MVCLNTINNTLQLPFPCSVCDLPLSALPFFLSRIFLWREGRRSCSFLLAWDIRKNKKRFPQQHAKNCPLMSRETDSIQGRDLYNFKTFPKRRIFFPTTSWLTFSKLVAKFMWGFITTNEYLPFLDKLGFRLIRTIVFAHSNICTWDQHLEYPSKTYKN